MNFELHALCISRKGAKRQRRKGDLRLRKVAVAEGIWEKLKFISKVPFF
jgi:hypothetical protein